MSMQLPNPLPPDENRGHVYFGVLVGLGIPSIIAVAMRTFVRIKYTKMGWDDYMMLIALPLLIANHGLSIASIDHGIGRHIFYLQIPDAIEAARLNVIAQPLNVLALFFTKASIVLFLVRLKPDTHYLWILWSTFAMNIVITVECLIVIFAQCQPFAKGWNPLITEGFCWSPQVFQKSAYTLSAVTIFTDIVYIVIPIFFLWNVQISKRVKIAIFAILGLGVVSMACSIAAIPFIYQLALSVDPTWTIVDLAATKSGELNVAILCACMPPMQPLFKRTGELLSTLMSQNTFFSRITGSRTTRGTRDSKSGSRKWDVPVTSKRQKLESEDDHLSVTADEYPLSGYPHGAHGSKIMRNTDIVVQYN